MKNHRRYIITALFCEARPLIDPFCLKKNTEHGPFQVFENESVRLIISGIGKVRSATAVSYLMARELPSMIVNIGISGSSDIKKPIGDLFAIHKITDHATSRDFYPEMLVGHDLNEAALITFDKPVLDAKDAGSGLVDMEASGYFQAASMFLPIQNIHCLKIVSDHLAIGHLDKAYIEDIVSQKTSVLRSWLDRSEILIPGQNNWTDQDESLMSGISDKLRLTETQRHQLRNWCRSYRIRTHKSLDSFVIMAAETIQTKSENKHALERLRQVLLA